MRADAELQQEAVVVAKISCWNRIFSMTSLRAADEVRAAQRRAGVEVGSRVIGGQPRSRPMRFIIARDGREGLVGRLLRGVGDVAVRVDAERQLRVVAGLRAPASR